MKAKPEGPDSRAVRQMFGEIAHRYDFLNHVLSASIDRRWRRLATAKVQEMLFHVIDESTLPAWAVTPKAADGLPSPPSAAAVVSTSTGGPGVGCGNSGSAGVPAG